MKCDAMRIFDINNNVLNDKSIGPVTSMCHNEMIFGYVPIKHKGHFGNQYTKKFSFRSESNNVYTCDFNDINHGKNVVEFYKKKCETNWVENVKPVWNELIDTLETNKNIYQAELGRILGFPINLSNDGKQGNRMIAEFINIGENSGLLETYKDNNKKFVKLVDKNKIPKPEFNFKRSSKSKNEAYIFGIVENLTKESNFDFKLKWGLALPQWKKAPYDIAIMLNDKIVGLIEVDGSQHERRIEFFHKTEKSWEDRQRIDKEKTQLAADEGIPLFRIYESEIKKDTKEITKNRLDLFIKEKIISKI